MTREEAIKILADLTDNLFLHTWEEQYKALHMAIEALQADRPHGEWIRISNDWIDGTCGMRYFPIRCSICGYATYDDDATEFCPSCGADMRGKEE